MIQLKYAILLGCVVQDIEPPKNSTRFHERARNSGHPITVCTHLNFGTQKFRRNVNKPIVKSEKFNVDEWSLLREIWRSNYPHVILTAEADSLPTDAIV